MNPRPLSPDRVQELLPEERWSHTCRVRDLARTVGETYSLNEHQLALAALYHDLGKAFPRKEQQRRAESYRGSLNSVARSVPSLWHGPASAHYLLEVSSTNRPGYPVLQAVAEHTTGHPSPTDVLLAIMVADFCEPGRDFEFAHTLRARIGESSLESLACQTLTYKIDLCLENNRLVHPRSLEAYNQLCA